MNSLARLITIVASVWFIIIGGLLLRPGKVPICIVCGQPGLDVSIKVIGLVLAVAVLVAALRTPAIDTKVGAGMR